MDTSSGERKVPRGRALRAWHGAPARRSDGRRRGPVSSDGCVSRAFAGRRSLVLSDEDRLIRGHRARSPPPRPRYVRCRSVVGLDHHARRSRARGDGGADGPAGCSPSARTGTRAGSGPGITGALRGGGWFRGRERLQLRGDQVSVWLSYPPLAGFPVIIHGQGCARRCVDARLLGACRRRAR